MSGLLNQHGESILTLKNSIRDTQVATNIYFRLAGEVGVGKSTLFARFKDLNGPPYDETTEIPHFNRSVFGVNAELEPGWNSGLYAVIVDFEPAPDPWAAYAASFRTAAPLLGAIVFCIDVNEREQIASLEGRVAAYRRYFRQNMPPFILVGTKMDLRDDTLEEQPGFSTHEGNILASVIRATGYFECSAWENVGVRQLFDNILRLVVSHT
ncbi:uncharacterized protein NPIL_339751 [Nephila pilipes]|uniref:Uncharacterized protein n=1 Tax=Nephila pilipes TaxID=299642 RepID=A0A8X6J0C3_NEPPI|nr:uncharacterized protein NPIL_339751 [Nephila pilipes]